MVSGSAVYGLLYVKFMNVCFLPDIEFIMTLVSLNL